MEKDILDGPIGDVGSYDLEFKGGYLVAKVAIAKDVGFGVSAEGSILVKVGADALIDALKAKIPGTIDDAIFDVIKAALKL